MLGAGANPCVRPIGSTACDTILTQLQRSLDAIAVVAVAPECAACGGLLHTVRDGAVCEACWKAVLAAAPPRAGLGEGRARTLDALRSISGHEGALRRVIHALKYGKRRSVARPLGRLMREHAADVLAGADVAVPVPLHWTRRRERGFNQAELLARELGLPVMAALRRTRRTRPQVELPAPDRLTNVAGAFALRRRDAWRMRRGRRRHPLAGRTVVLVDDVCTTGATLEACARVLEQAGAVSVRAVTAARVPTPLV